MSLKTDWLTSSPSGFATAMNTVFDAGAAWVTTNSSAISTALKANAAQGLKTFTVNVAVTFETANLRLEGFHWESFKAGIISQFAAEDIYSYEVSPELNTDDSSSTSIDLNFTF